MCKRNPKAMTMMTTMTMTTMTMMVQEFGAEMVERVKRRTVAEDLVMMMMMTTMTTTTTMMMARDIIPRVSMLVKAHMSEKVLILARVQGLQEHHNLHQRQQMIEMIQVRKLRVGVANLIMWMSIHWLLLRHHPFNQSKSLILHQLGVLNSIM